MVLSPLWFVFTYLFFVCMMPITVWLHRRYDALVLVFLAGLAVIVDILRFRYQVPGVEWINMVFVWGFAFQLGYFHGRISGVDSAPRYSDGRIDWAYQSPRTRQQALIMTFAGLFGLIGLVFSGLYPGSMVGVPGEDSNMAPPTLCIIALTIFQVGVAELIRPVGAARAQPRRGLRQGHRCLHPVRPAAVPVPHHRHGAVPRRRMVDLRHPGRGHRTHLHVVAAATGGHHRAAAGDPAGDLPVRPALEHPDRRAAAADHPGAGRRGRRRRRPAPDPAAG